MSFPDNREDWGWAILWFVVVFYQFFPSFSNNYGRSTRMIYKRYMCKIAGAPPPWLFAPVWVILYAAIAIGLWLVHRDTSLEANTRSSYDLLILFGLLSVLFNKMWMPAFTGCLNFGLALAVLLLAWGFALAFIVIAALRGRWIPFGLWLAYVLWLTYAAYLNCAFLRYQKCIKQVACALLACDRQQMQACLDQAEFARKN